MSRHPYKAGVRQARPPMEVVDRVAQGCAGGFGCLVVADEFHAEVVDRTPEPAGSCPGVTDEEHSDVGGHDHTEENRGGDQGQPEFDSEGEGPGEEAEGDGEERQAGKDAVAPVDGPEVGAGVAGGERASAVVGQGGDCGEQPERSQGAPGRQAGRVAGSFAPGSVETEVDLALRPRWSPELPPTKLSQLVELLFAGCGTRRVPGRSQGHGGISRAQVRASQ